MKSFLDLGLTYVLYNLNILWITYLEVNLISRKRLMDCNSKSNPEI